MLASVPVLQADDTEVFFGQAGASVNAAANVLFILDNSGSMREYDGGEVRRIDRMKRAMLDIIDNTANVNIGLASFNGSEIGGSILFPVTHVGHEVCPDASCTELVTVGRIESGADDADQLLQGGFDMDLDSDSIDIGRDRENSALLKVAGLRFSNLNVPRGATINSAYIQMQSDEDTPAPTAFMIVGELTGNAQPYANVPSNISARASTVAAESWFTESWEYSDRYHSSDVSTIVQEITSQTDWCGGNALALMISGGEVRLPKSFENAPMSAPVLKVNYDPSSVDYDNTCISRQIVAAVASANDDASENKTDNSVEVSGTVLEVPLGAAEQIVGLRFGKISIPQGAVVTNAYIELQSSDVQAGSLDLTLYGEAADSAAPFAADAGNISSRTRLATSVAWPGVSDLGIDERVSSPDLASIVNAIVNRAGWQANNSLAIFIERASGSGSLRNLYSFEGNAVSAARLHIKYVSPSSSANKPVLQTAREQLRQVTYDFQPLSGTPLVDAYLEGAQYMLGRPVYFGKERGNSRGYARHFRVSHPGSYTGGTVQRNEPWCSDDTLSDAACIDEIIAGSPVYRSPIENTCQANQIILLSDGMGNHNNSVSEITDITGGSCTNPGNIDEVCGRELAGWLSTKDVSPAIAGEQTIITNTVGFNFTDDFLREIAVDGGGQFHEADSASQLTHAFQSIFTSIADVDTTFVAPSVAVNQLNRLTNRSDIYFSLFKPGLQPKWAGNVKKFKLGVDSSSGDDSVQIIDVAGKVAVDAVTGGFKSTAQSYWSDTVDGATVGSGGVAGELATGRNVLTYLPGDSSFTNRSLGSTADVSKALLGIPSESDAYHSNLLAWSVGQDIKDVNENSNITDARQEMGDPLHSSPVLINYADVGGSAASVLFFGTNEGFLHAVNSTDGKELSALIPPELLPNLNEFYTNDKASPHPYGLDGPITGWIRNDINNNLTVDPSEQALLFVGMRRGGANYYAIDVTNPANPQVKWVIRGGSPGFEKLGQSWSKPVVTRIRMGTVEQDVLIFAGGYDVINDNPSNMRVASNTGDTIYIVNALDGSLIWSASDVDFPDMVFSIPSNIRVIEQDANGTADRLYVGDMGGQLWRFDIDNYNSTATELLVNGGVLAVLGDGSSQNNRRFFYEPDVALVGQHGKDFLAVSFGSGWRAHPLDTGVQDRFYSIRDYAVYRLPRDGAGDVSYPAFNESDLTDVTTYTTGVEPAVTNGWFIDMESNGEKVLSEAVTANYQIVFTSYLPESSSGACSAAVGSGSVYVLDLFNAAPVLNLDETLSIDPLVDNDLLTKSDRKRELRQMGIPPSPKVLFPADSPPITLAGTEKVPVEIEPRKRTYWVEK